jgi:hypothetical protein
VVLRDTLIDAGLLSHQQTSLSGPNTLKAIHGLMDRVPERRILLLLDEADRFLEASSREESEFYSVNQLINLMEETDFHFKVVFAGNYNTQRFAHVRNQRLTRNGEPVVVGPLETTAAIDLVRKPTFELGFRFEGQDVVLKILSYTSSHANLMQFYMHELLQEAYMNATAGDPPYTITAREVDELYSRTTVQEIMQRRIALTLELDIEYRLISFVAALHDGGGSPDSHFTRFYKLPELLKLAREAWPAGFDRVTVGLMRSKLEEMCGLGLLIRNRDGAYRLASAGMMRLFGTIDEIQEKVNDIARTEPEAYTSDDEQHAWVANTPERYSPLTCGQERLLARDRYGVRLVPASRALGDEDVVGMLQRLLPAKTSAPIEARCVEVPAEVQGAGWTGHLKALWDAAAESGVFVLYQRVPVQTSKSLADAVHAIAKYLDLAARNQKRSLRVVLLFDPSVTAIWRSIPEETRQGLEDKAQGIIVPRRWEKAALRQRLEETKRNYSDQSCDSILATTGGWPRLLDELFARWPSSEETVSQATARLTADLTRGGKLAGPFFRSLGIEPGSAPGRLLNYCAAQEEVFLELLLEAPDLPVRPEELSEAIEILKQFGLASEVLDKHGWLTLKLEPVAAGVWLREASGRLATAAR